MTDAKENLKKLARKKIFNKNPEQSDMEELQKLYHFKKYEKAKKITNDLLKTFTDSEFLHNMMGAIFNEENKYEESIKWHKRAIKINPNYAEGYNNLGVVLTKMGKLNEAVNNFQQAIKLKQTFVNAYSNMAYSLTALGKLDLAIESCQKAIKINPDFFEAYKSLGAILCKIGKFSEATKSYQRALEINPEDRIVPHTLSALLGYTTKTAPEEYVVDLFDNYANRYDKHLTEKLKYRVPEKLVTLLKKVSKKKLSFVRALDMGCGTGLTGSVFRSSIENFIGIDVSEKMLKKAEEKNIYDYLEHQDILGYLEKSSKKFDLFLCADVLVYTGNLDEIFYKVSVNSNTNARFCFSVEKSDNVEFLLTKIGRYAHSKQYIYNLSKKYNFITEACDETEIRSESNVSINGYIFILKKIRSGDQGKRKGSSN